MKLKINKACDLSSISVLPPQSRRLNGVPTGPQASQIRSQTSQQSFSQGISSQYGMFSQLSQSSLDETMTNDQLQRLGSQEREISVKKASCFPQIGHTREESHMVLSRSSTQLKRKWNPSLTDHKCQINEELEHRFGMMETSLNKFGMVLDSVQSDIMQVNKGTKELSLELEGIRQKLIVVDSSLQLMKKEQENVKSSLDGSLKSISEQLSKAMCQDMLHQILLVLSALPQQMEASLQKLQDELCLVFAKEMQSMACNLKGSNIKGSSVNGLLPKAIGGQTSTQKLPDPPKKPALLPNLSGQRTTIRNVIMGGWNSVKLEKMTFSPWASHIDQNHNGVSSFQQEKQSRLVIESDEDIDGGFSCLINDKETGFGNTIINEAKEETERILRKARRRKRKYCNTIIID